MRTLMIALVVAAVLPSCRLFMPEKYEARDRCAAAIPILREYPSGPYRIVGGKTVGITHEQALRYEACAVGAEAVVVSAGQDETVSKRRGQADPVLVGVFITYTREIGR